MLKSSYKIIFTLCILCLICLLGCRPFAHMFDLKESRRQEIKGNPCLDTLEGWEWFEGTAGIGAQCLEIQSHFIAANLAYLRVLWHINRKLSPLEDILKKDFFSYYKDASSYLKII